MSEADRQLIAIIREGDPARAEAEALVEQRFRECYGAEVRSPFRLIAAWPDSDGRIAAAAGVRFAETEALFLERYLDEPVEQALAAAYDRPVARDQVVEIGGLAAREPTAALNLFHGLVAWLPAACGRRFAVATMRPELQRLLDRTGFGLKRLGSADPARLGSEALGWGSYYDAGPAVCAGEIRPAPLLPDLRRRLRTKLMLRQVRRSRGEAS